ncbi:MAG: minor capsid protein [Bacilli bacterium]
MKSSEYWEQRIANGTWKIYNALEQRNKDLLEMYQEASLNISEELYKVAEKLKTSTPMLSDMHKFGRLTELQENMENVIKELGESVEKFGKDNMSEGFDGTYKNVMAQLGKTEFAKVPKKVMEEMMDRAWLGSNFSERLWKNTQVLAVNLNDILTNGITQGKTITEMAIQLNNMMNSGFNVSHRLIRTETMHYLNESAFKGYEDAGCEEVEVWAAKDERVCEVCGAMHGKVYKIKKRPVLPLHANCRCTYLPIIKDTVEAINKNGKKINFNLEGMKSKRVETVKKVIIDLSSQYNTSLNSVYVNKNGKEAGKVNMAYDMYLSSTRTFDIVHEFAHTLAMTNSDKLKLTDNKEFWKEIKKVRREYTKEVANDYSKVISSYSLESVDEFMAEAFTQSYLKDTNELSEQYSNNYEYGDKVKRIVNKYFKK